MRPMTVLKSTYPPPLSPSHTHCWEAFNKRGYCVWCKKQSKESELKRVRPALVEIGNQSENQVISAPMASTQTVSVSAQAASPSMASAQAVSAPATRKPRGYGGYKICRAYLCLKELVLRYIIVTEAINSSLSSYLNF